MEGSQGTTPSICFSVHPSCLVVSRTSVAPLAPVVWCNPMLLLPSLTLLFVALVARSPATLRGPDLMSRTNSRSSDKGIGSWRRC